MSVCFKLFVDNVFVLDFDWLIIFIFYFLNLNLINYLFGPTVGEGPKTHNELILKELC